MLHSKLATCGKSLFIILTLASLISTVKCDITLASEEPIEPASLSEVSEETVEPDYNGAIEMGQPAEEHVIVQGSEGALDQSVPPASPDIIQDAAEGNATGSGEANATSNATANATDTHVNCAQRSLAIDEVPQVMLVNSSALLKILTPVPNVTAGECAVVMFYSTWCIFSARAAPHFNAMARVFPQIHFLALNAATYSGLNMRYGLVALPTMLLFHNGRAIAKFNDTEPKLQKLVTFVTKFTGLVPNVTVNVTTADFFGPVPAKPQPRIDYALILAWLFTLACLSMWFLKSSLWQRIVESVRNNWREAEAQHEHAD